jgi:hypothetical protein
LKLSTFVEQSKNIVVENRINFKVRIGVNSGSIVAGIVGTKSLPMTSGRQLTSPLAWSQTQLQENQYFRKHFQLVKNHLLVNTEGKFK